MRLMGLWGSDLDFQASGRAAAFAVTKPLTLPRRAGGDGPRVDLQIARHRGRSACQSYGLTRTTHFINVLDAGGISKTQKDKAAASRTATAAASTIEFQVPIFDFGRPRVSEAEQRYIQAVNLLAEQAVNARSEAREAYRAYRVDLRDRRSISSARCCHCARTSPSRPNFKSNAMQIDVFRAAHEARAASLRRRSRHRGQAQFLARHDRPQRRQCSAAEARAIGAEARFSRKSCDGKPLIDARRRTTMLVATKLPHRLGGGAVGRRHGQRPRASRSHPRGADQQLARHAAA